MLFLYICVRLPGRRVSGTLGSKAESEWIGLGIILLSLFWYCSFLILSRKWYSVILYHYHMAESSPCKFLFVTDWNMPGTLVKLYSSLGYHTVSGEYLLSATPQSPDLVYITGKHSDKSDYSNKWSVFALQINLPQWTKDSIIKWHSHPALTTMHIHTWNIVQMDLLTGISFPANLINKQYTLQPDPGSS